MEEEKLLLEGQISDLVSEHLNSLFELWLQTGFTSGDRQDRITVVKRQIDATLSEMVDEEKKNFDELLKKIQMREREHVALSKELGIYINQESRANKMASLTILELDKELRDDVQQLKALKEERMREVLKLKALDEKLCQAIKMEPIYVPTKVVPTDEQLETLKQHIREMEALKNQRFEKFTELKAEILNLYEQLETEPNTSFEREVVCEEDEAFVLSSVNLDHVETMLLGLRNQLSSNIKSAETLREKISNLFEKLEISGKDAFLTAHKGYSKMVIEELEFKLKELDVLKLQHLEEFILKSRNELEHWWNLCYYGAAQQHSFTPFYSNDFSEELLEKHEHELEKIKKHYNDNAPLFAMVQEVQNLWAKRLELECLSKDPTRLGNYKILAQEEKDRKRVNHRLPKVQELLFAAIQDYEDQHGTAFLVGGVPFVDYWEGQLEKHNQNLANEKQQKSSIKKQLNYHETIYGSVPANINKTTIKSSNKRPLEEMMTNGKTKQLKMERSQTVSALSSARSNTASLQRTQTHSSLSSARSATLQRAAASRYAQGNYKMMPRRVLRDRNDSIITGTNQIPHTTLDSVDSNCQAGFHAEAVSSTFRFDPETPTRSNLRGAVFGTPGKTFIGTPSKPLLKSSTPKASKGFVFRTPTSRAPTPGNKTQTLSLRSGKRLPFLI